MTIALSYYLPPDASSNARIMHPAARWPLAPMVIDMGGHGRVSRGGKPCLPNGNPALHKAESVDVIVEIADSIGRRVAMVEPPSRIVLDHDNRAVAHA